MDASDYGLCALFPARHEFLQVKFTSAEREQIERFNRSASSQYCINVRELMSAVFVALVWGQYSSGPSTGVEGHVCFWIDNQPAISWNYRCASSNPQAQLML